MIWRAPPVLVELPHRLLADHVARAIAEQPLGALVEQDDLAAQVGGDDRVDGRVDQALEELLGRSQLVLERALGGDVAEREDHGAGAGEHRRGRRRDPDRRARRRRQLEVERVDVDAGEHARDRVGDLARAARSATRSTSSLPSRPSRAKPVIRSAARLTNRMRPGVVEHDHTVGAGLEVLLERVDAAQPALGLVARARDPVRLVAQALEHGAVAQVRGGDARDQLAELDAARPDVARRPACACAAGSRRASGRATAPGTPRCRARCATTACRRSARSAGASSTSSISSGCAACASPRRPRDTR